MCHFISAVLPGSADLSALAGVMAHHGRALKPQRNPALEAQLQAGEQLLLTTAGHCDCGTALGALERYAARLERIQIRCRLLRHEQARRCAKVAAVSGLPQIPGGDSEGPPHHTQHVQLDRDLLGSDAELGERPGGIPATPMAPALLEFRPRAGGLCGGLVLLHSDPSQPAALIFWTFKPRRLKGALNSLGYRPIGP